MISHISIRDFAIIEQIDIDLHPGLNIITGETGAGKSIIIEAISQALGSRADTAMVRSGHDKALVQILLGKDDGLSAQDEGGPELLTREISAGGKSISRIDGEIVTLGQLSSATRKVADIHGQYDHQSLLNPDNHIELVDAYRKDIIDPARARVAARYAAYSEAKHRYDQLLASENATKRELDFLSFEVREIESTNPQPGEYEELTEQLKILQNSEKIFEGLAAAYEDLTDSGGALEQLGRAMASLEEIAPYAENFKALADTVSEAYYNIEETAATLRTERERVDFSEQSLSEAMSRLDLLERLIAKYGGSGKGDMAGVLDYLRRAKDKLETIENIDERKAQLKETLAQTEAALAGESLSLSKLRRAAAFDLEAQIEEQLKELNFKDALFRIHFEKNYGLTSDEVDSNNITSTAPPPPTKTGTSSNSPQAETATSPAPAPAPAPAPKDFTANGIDRIEFLMTANRGQPLLPISKVASGGELSRIMLAFKSVTGAFDRIPTMIFDEIDSGISGVTATIVGEKLKQMASLRQIICITHLPQIAAFADHHFVIEKDTDNKTTYTTINEITDENRVVEIARLLGGKNVTATTLKSARELIALSQD